MPNYRVQFCIHEDRITAVKKKMAEVLSGLPETALTVTKINPSPSRADRLSDAEGQVGDAASVVRELEEEVRGWYDNLPENLQGGDKGSRLEECADALGEIADALEGCDFGSVEFPGMFD